MVFVSDFKLTMSYLTRHRFFRCELALTELDPLLNSEFRVIKWPDITLNNCTSFKADCESWVLVLDFDMYNSIRRRRVRVFEVIRPRNWKIILFKFERKLEKIFCVPVHWTSSMLSGALTVMAKIIWKSPMMIENFHTCLRNVGFFLGLCKKEIW